MADDQFVAPVVRNGGLTVEQIEIRDMRVEEKIVRMWTHAMDEQSKRLDERFEIHEQKDKLRNKDQQEVASKRLDSQDGKLDKLLEQVECVISTNRDWHAEDLVFRDAMQKDILANRTAISDVSSKVEIVAAQQEDINTKFNLIQWLVMMTKSITKGSDLTVAVAERGKQVGGAVAGITGTVLVVWQTMRSGGILDVIKGFINKHH